MSQKTFGQWCLYKDSVFCQERAECMECQVYYDTMPLPYLGKTVEESEKRSKRKRAIDKALEEVYWYGGFPMMLGSIIIDMDKAAKNVDKKNWFKIREAGLLGLMLYNKRHPMPLGTEPITLQQFYVLTGIDRGEV